MNRGSKERMTGGRSGRRNSAPESERSTTSSRVVCGGGENSPAVVKESRVILGRSIWTEKGPDKDEIDSCSLVLCRSRTEQERKTVQSYLRFSPFCAPSAVSYGNACDRTGTPRYSFCRRCGPGWLVSYELQIRLLLSRPGEASDRGWREAKRQDALLFIK